MNIYILLISSVTTLIICIYIRLQCNLKIKILQVNINDLEEDQKKKTSQIDDYIKNNTKLSTNVAILKTQNDFLSNQIKEQKQNFIDINSNIKLEFKDLATNIIEEKTKIFTSQNKNIIEGILTPLGNKINEFQKQIDQTNKDDITRTTFLRAEIKKLNDLNIQISQDAKNLTTALKGDNKVQGNWGEFILESILEKSGLTKNQEYFVQETFRNEQDGKLYKPDIIINLPDQRNIIIDSKLSLLDYEKSVNEEDTGIKTNYVKAHIQSIRNHIKILSTKGYSLKYKLANLDFVLMFIPIEPAFALAIQNDHSLFAYAYDKNIVLTSPTTLIATLKTIKHIWKTEYQNKNVQEIARQGGALYDKFVGFTEEFISIGEQIIRTQKTYQNVSKKLYDGKDNLIKKTERLKELGAKTTKIIRPELLDKAIYMK